MALETAKVLLAVIGALYVAWQYDEAVDKERKARSQLLITEYNHGVIANSRIELEKNWFLREIPYITKDLGRPAEIISDKLVDFLKIHFFFNDVAICGYNNVCDYKVLCAALSRDMEAQRHTYGIIYKRWGEVWGEDMLINIDKFLNQKCAGELAEHWCSKENPSEDAKQLCNKYRKLGGRAHDMRKHGLEDVLS